MVAGWRRAFCTSIPKEREAIDQRQQHCNNNSHSPRISSKFGFFSNPSTPRLQSQPVSSPVLRCRTIATTPTTPASSLPTSPKLLCKTTTPKQSNPSSPKSPSTFTFLRNSLRLSKNRCGICAQSVRSGQGTAIFTAECNHVFHFPCVAAQLKKQSPLVCAVCNTTWKELPLLSVSSASSGSAETVVFSTTTNSNIDHSKHLKLRVYNDDEPLMSPSPGSLFNPIPELEENDVEDDQEFQGFFVNPSSSKLINQVLPNERKVQVSLLPDSAVLATGKRHEIHVVVLRVRAPLSLATRRRAPIDLVTVLDVSERMSGVRIQMVKRAMRLVLSSLNSTDRLSIVAFSGCSKRLLPLRRMTPSGRRSARRIVDAIGSTNSHGMMSVSDALKKAAKVIEDRREKNPVSTILILSNGQDDRSHWNPVVNQKQSSPIVSIMRYSHLEIPVHSIGFGEISAYNHAQAEDVFAKCLGGVLNVVVQDVKVQLGVVSGSAPVEISAVYSSSSRPVVFGPGSVRVGDLHGGEEREFLVELKVPTSSVGSRHLLSVRASLRDPSSQELILSKEQALLLPRAQDVRSLVPNIQRLRDVHVSTRAVAESGRLAEHGDLSGAYHLLSSARALLLQSNGDGSVGEHIRGLEAELAEMHRRRRHVVAQQGQRQRGNGQQMEEKPEPLTPTSAWRAAERLAKVAIMRKHMNRVSDLHGFENARF